MRRLPKVGGGSNQPKKLEEKIPNAHSVLRIVPVPSSQCGKMLQFTVHQLEWSEGFCFSSDAKLGLDYMLSRFA